VGQDKECVSPDITVQAGSNKGVMREKQSTPVRLTENSARKKIATQFNQSVQAKPRAGTLVASTLDIDCW
jgi:hypothetical protein